MIMFMHGKTTMNILDVCWFYNHDLTMYVKFTNVLLLLWMSNTNNVNNQDLLEVFYWKKKEKRYGYT